MKTISAVCAALTISSVTLIGQAQAPTEITYVGCLREWKPATDVTRYPESTGTYLLTPIATFPTITTDSPTYLLTTSLTVNFAAHLDDKVEVVGTVRPAPVRSFVGSLSGVTPRPEERPETQSMPRLTIRSLKKISDACPS